MTENVASRPSVKVATPPCAAKAAIPCGLAGGKLGGINALATKQSPGLFLPNADAFGASCLLHCVQFTREQAPALRLFMALWQQKRRRGG